jgi:hypothetical protein
LRQLFALRRTICNRSERKLAAFRRKTFSPARGGCVGQIQVESRVPDMKAMANGNYLVTLERNRLMNVAVKDGKATCVKASDPGLKGMQGVIQTMKSGVFLIRFQNDRGAMSQVWIFREDGTAGVRELPDSGELQSAVPVKDDSLTPPKKTR